MSYHYSYGFDDGREEEGDDFASGGGWAAWVDFVVEETDGLEACDLLALEGWAMLDEIKPELPNLREQIDNPDLQHITDRLIQACKDAPDGCTVLMIGDGIEGDDDGDEDEDEEE